METLSIRFVVAAKRFDPDGYLYSVDSEAADLATLAGTMLGTRRLQVDGGLLLITGDRVWNWHLPVRFDAKHIPINLDSVLSALLFVEDFCTYFPMLPEFIVNLTAITRLRVQQSSETVQIEGLTDDDIVCFPPLQVSTGAFLHEIADATRRAVILLESLRGHLEQSGADNTLLTLFDRDNRPERWVEALRCIESLLSRLA